MIKKLVITAIIILIVLLGFMFFRSDGTETTDIGSPSAGSTEPETQTEPSIESDDDVLNEIDNALDSLG
jgi:hypothetical protein